MQILTKRSIISGLITSVFLVSVFTIPQGIFAGTKKIYVDDSAKGTKDGTSKNPYDSLESAIKKAKKQDESVEIHILKGEYKGNFELPKNVKLYGSGREKVIIKAKNDNEPVIKISGGNTVSDVTISGGSYGIKISDGKRVKIFKTTIEKAKKDGIKIETSPLLDEKHQVLIMDSSIKNNDKNGIYSEKRKIVLINNEIKNNNGDGIELAAGTVAWIDGNHIKDNNKSGAKLTLDGSQIWTKNNTYRDNGREGVEVNSFGGKGAVDLKKSKFYQNRHNGVAKVQRGVFSGNVWSGLTLQNDNAYWENKSGNISPVIHI